MACVDKKYIVVFDYDLWRGLPARLGGTAANDLILTQGGRAWGRAGDDFIVDGDAAVINPALRRHVPADPVEYGREAYDSRLSGGAGDDVIIAGDGYDTVFAGPGDDYIAGDAVELHDTGSQVRLPPPDYRFIEERDRISVAECSDGDGVWKGQYRDKLYGGPGQDAILGGPGSDHLQGGPGYDVLLGGEGRDVLVPGKGGEPAEEYQIDGDLLIGGSGKDVYDLRDIGPGRYYILYSSGDKIILPREADVADLPRYWTPPFMVEFLRDTGIISTRPGIDAIAYSYLLEIGDSEIYFVGDHPNKRGFQGDISDPDWGVFRWDIEDPREVENVTEGHADHNTGDFVRYNGFPTYFALTDEADKVDLSHGYRGHLDRTAYILDFSAGDRIKLDDPIGAAMREIDVWPRHLAQLREVDASIEESALLVETRAGTTIILPGVAKDEARLVPHEGELWIVPADDVFIA